MSTLQNQKVLSFFFHSHEMHLLAHLVPLHQIADFPTLSYTSTSDNQKPEKGTCTSLASNSRGTKPLCRRARETLG